MKSTRSLLVRALVAGIVALTLLSTTQTASATGVSNITFEGKTIRFEAGYGAGKSDLTTVRDLVSNLLGTRPDGNPVSENFRSYVRSSTRARIAVFVYRNINTVHGGEADFATTPTSTGENAVHIDLTDNERMVKHLEEFNQTQRDIIAPTANKWVLAHEFGHMNGTRDPQTRENAVLTDIGAGWQRVDYRKSGCPTKSNMRVGTTNGALNITNWFDASKNNWSGWSGVAEDACGIGGVGGILELPDAKAAPIEATESDGRNYAPLIIAVIVLGIIISFTVVQYIRRRSLH